MGYPAWEEKHMNSEARVYVGKKAVELVAAFPFIFPSVSCFYFKSYRPVPGVKVRLKVNELSIQELRARYPKPDTLVSEMLKHVNDDETKSSIEICADELVVRLPQLAAECSERKEALAVYSLCRAKNGDELHIPMMDFSFKAGLDNGDVDLLHAAVKGVRQQRGVIVDSGNSYHYYGLRLLPQSEWRWFMAGCVLLEPLVDVRYISHRLLAGKAALRLTTAPGKDKEPSVVSCL
jgi:hypothetical protein